MIQRALWIVCACTVVFVPTAGWADFRVVVQEAHVNRRGTMQLSVDGKYAWAVTGVNQHVLQIIEPKGPKPVPAGDIVTK